MSRQAEYVSAWIDTTIHDFLMGVDQPTSNMRYALITCLDSSTNVRAIADREGYLKNLKGKIVGNGLLVKAEQLIKLERKHRLFFGFDEIWFFPSPNIDEKPGGWIITGPDPINSNELDKYGGWMRSNHCVLGLGDGVGMNFCLPGRGAAKLLFATINAAHAVGSAS